MSALPFLSDVEIAALCDGLTLPGAQVRYLSGLGLLVHRKPNGKPLVARSEFERVLGAGRFAPASNDASTAGPNVVGLMNHLNKGKPHHGSKKG